MDANDTRPNPESAQTISVPDASMPDQSGSSFPDTPHSLSQLSDLSHAETSQTKTSSKQHQNTQNAVKSSSYVGELFDNSLQHALKINAISAGVKSSRHSPEPQSDQMQGNRPNKSNNLVPSVRLSNENIAPRQDKPVPFQQSAERDNTGLESLTVSAVSSSESFYPSPSGPNNRRLNQTYGLDHTHSLPCNFVPSDNREKRTEENQPEHDIKLFNKETIHEKETAPSKDVKKSIDSGLNSSYADSGRISPVPSVVSSEVGTIVHYVNIRASNFLPFLFDRALHFARLSTSVSPC